IFCRPLLILLQMYRVSEVLSLRPRHPLLHRHPNEHPRKLPPPTLRLRAQRPRPLKCQPPLPYDLKPHSLPPQLITFLLFQTPRLTTAGSGWSEDSTTWAVPIPLRVEALQNRRSPTSFSAKGPHYTVRAHSSVSDVYAFGQDVTWQEAHYEDTLPASPPPSRFAYPPIDVMPPTPPSGVIYPNTASAKPLPRSHSAASSISSVYSTTSMVFPDLFVPPDIMTQASVRESLDDRNWLVDVQAPPSDGQGPRRLV
ncbi:hypothetical protein DFH09DRAFT_1181424, partial [Mycena vulgaris]